MVTLAWVLGAVTLPSAATIHSYSVCCFFM